MVDLGQKKVNTRSPFFYLIRLTQANSLKTNSVGITLVNKPYPLFFLLFFKISGLTII